MIKSGDCPDHLTSLFKETAFTENIYLSTLRELWAVCTLAHPVGTTFHPKL